MLHITDAGTEEFLVDDEVCEYWHVVIWDESLGEIVIEESDTMTVSCPEMLASLIEDTDGHLANGAPGEVRTVKVFMCGRQDIDATLTITEARGRELQLPETTTADYLRRFTLTAECTCDSRCRSEGTWRLELEGEQTAADVQAIEQPSHH